MNEYARPRAARYEDYEDELDREYLDGGNRYGQLARRRDLGRTMRGVIAPYSDKAPWCTRRYDEYQSNNRWQPMQDDGDWQRNHYDMEQSSYPQTTTYQEDEDPYKEFREEMRSMFKELTEKIDRHAGDVNELKKQVSQLASAVYETEEELSEDSVSVAQADVSTIMGADVSIIMVNQETSAEQIEETSAEISDSGKESPISCTSISNTPLPFQMQVVAPEDHIIDNDELKDELEARYDEEKPMVEHLHATRQAAPPEKCKESYAFTITRDVDSYILQMGDAKDDDPPAPTLKRALFFATKTEFDSRTCLMSLVFSGKRSNFNIYEDADRSYSRKRPRHGTFGWKPGWRDTGAPLKEGYEHHRGVAKFDLTRPWDPNL